MQSEYQNPFDNTQHQFFVLMNDREQPSLWPNFTDIPAGWHVIFGPDDKQKCLSFLSNT